MRYFFKGKHKIFFACGRVKPNHKVIVKQVRIYVKSDEKEERYLQKVFTSEVDEVNNN